MTTKNLTFEKTNTKTTNHSLAARLIEVMRECGYVKKDAQNNFHKYRYASASAVLEKVNEALCKYRIATLMNTELISSGMEGKEKFATVKTTIHLVDPDTGETMDISGIGSGQDSGDKAIAKAQTMALKYAWMMSLNISTGDDPEADETTDHRNHHKYMAASFVQRNGNHKVAEQNSHDLNHHAGGHVDPNVANAHQGADYWADLYTKANNWEEFKSIKQNMGADTFNRFSNEEKSIIMAAANKAKERFGNG